MLASAQRDTAQRDRDKETHEIAQIVAQRSDSVSQLFQRKAACSSAQKLADRTCAEKLGLRACAKKLAFRTCAGLKIENQEIRGL